MASILHHHAITDYFKSSLWPSDNRGFLLVCPEDIRVANGEYAYYGKLYRVGHISGSEKDTFEVPVKPLATVVAQTANECQALVVKPFPRYHSGCYRQDRL